MDDLAAFLRACLDKDEEIATWARGTIPVRRPGDGSGNVRPLRRADEQTRDLYSAIFRPERVLAEVEAKRRILDEHATTQTNAIGDGMRVVDVDVCRTCSNKHGVPCTTLRLLALPYADVDGYREEWRL